MVISSSKPILSDLWLPQIVFMTFTNLKGAMGHSSEMQPLCTECSLMKNTIYLSMKEIAYFMENPTT
jgi:hypothetical protein